MASAILNAGALAKTDHPKPTSNQNGEDEVNPPMVGNVSNKNPSMIDDVSNKTPTGSTRRVSKVESITLEQVREESLSVSENRVSDLREKIASNQNIQKPALEAVKPPPVSSAISLEPVREESLPVTENRVWGLREKIASNRNIQTPAPEPVKPSPLSSANRRVSQVGG